MPKNVQLPDGRVVAFPDTMSDDDVSSAISKDLAANVPSQHPVLDAVKDFGKGVLKSGIGTMSAADDFAQKHLPAFMTTPIGQKPNAENSARAVEAAKQMATPNGTAQSIGKGIGNAAQFLIPGAAEEAGASMLAPTVGKLAARMATGAVGSGVVNTAQGGGFIPGAIAGAAGPVIAKGLKSIAPVIAEKALGVRGVDRALGKTPGDAILNDTTGLRPGVIANQANDVSNNLTGELEQRMVNAPDGSLLPARKTAESFRNTALTRNSPESIKRTGALLTQISEHMGLDGKPLSPSLPIPDTVPAKKLLDLKRGVGELQNSWNPAVPNKLGDSAVGRVYNDLDSQMDALAPGTKEMNQRISSLIPVANRAGAADLNDGLIARTIGRFGKPTGALVGAGLGAEAGHRETGTTAGAITGGVLGLVAPELLSNPRTLIGAARLMYSPTTGKLLPAAAGLGLQLNNK